MKVVAPGKLLLTGAYAVLEGAPGIVVAVDRYAVADPSHIATSPSLEVRAALRDGEPAPAVDVSALHDDSGNKLGLGSSAAALVASLAARAAVCGEDPSAPAVRARLFRAARAAHARAQGGGSGIDVAASVHGGTLRYALEGSDVVVRAVEAPVRLVVATYFSGASARTSELRARVAALRARTPRATVFGELHALAALAADAFEGGDADTFLSAARQYGRALDRLGHAADAPIVLPSFSAVASAAEAEGGAFLPSGAGGGDVAVWLGVTSPPPAVSARAAGLGLRPLAISTDRGGVRLHAPC